MGIVGAGPRAQVDAEMVIDEDHPGLGVSIDHPLTGVGVLDLIVSTGDVSRSGGKAPDVVKGLGDKGIVHVACAPHAETDANITIFLGSDGVDTTFDLGVLILHGFRIVGEAFAKFLDVVGCADVNVPASVLLHGVVGQGGVEHGEHLGGHVIEGDADVLEQVGVDSGEVVIDQVGETSGKFHAGGSATNDGEMEEVSFGFFRDDGKMSEFEQFEDAAADGLGIADVFEKHGILADPFCVEGLTVASHGDDQFVIVNGEGWDLVATGAADKSHVWF